MERVSLFRARALLALLVLLLGFFAVRLFDLQIIQTGGGQIDNSTTFVTKTRVKAARGDILDCNGNVLVGNRASYDLSINHYVLLSGDNPNEYIYQLVTLCQELGIEYTDNFPVTQTRPFTYTLTDYNSTWQGYFQTFLSDRDNLDSDITAPLLIEKLRESYGIPEEWTDEEARLVLGVRYELTLRNLTNLATYVFLADAADDELSALLELNVPGMNVEESTVREYNTTYAGHVLGYVSKMDAEQWAYYKELGYPMDAEVGQTGFELAFEEYLHGVDGYRIDKVAPDGTIVESYYDPAPQAGNNVEVTIDISLQQVAEDQLQIRLEELRNDPDLSKDGHDAEGAAVVIMEVETGKILACASSPGYDPATFHEEFNTLKEADYDPLFNRALQATYPPGSTFKMAMVITYMNAGILHYNDKITDYGKFTKYSDSGWTGSCLAWSSGGGTHHDINAAEALKVSCNYFFYEMSDRLGLGRLDLMNEVAAGLGLGEPTGVELPEKTGYRANEETKALFHVGTDVNFYVADLLMASIGQSENKFTPLQLCVYACTLANEGKRYAATFLNRVVSTDYTSMILENEPELLGTLDIHPDALAAVKDGMKLVATEGTADDTFATYPIPIAAKTGTAQTGISYASDNAAFLCYAPADDPKIAIVVYGEKAGHGSAMAIVARQLLDVYFEVGEVGDVTTYENTIS